MVGESENEIRRRKKRGILNENNKIEEFEGILEEYNKV